MQIDDKIELEELSGFLNRLGIAIRDGRILFTRALVYRARVRVRKKGQSLR